jgi:hypothetical protein
MPLYVYNNHLLISGDHPTADPDCCCGTCVCGNLYAYGGCTTCADFGFEDEAECQAAVEEAQATPEYACFIHWIGTLAECGCTSCDTTCDLVNLVGIPQEWFTETKSCTNGLIPPTCTSYIWCPCQEEEPPCPPGTTEVNRGIVYINFVDCLNIGDPYVYINCSSRSADAGVGPFCS